MVYLLFRQLLRILPSGTSDLRITVYFRGKNADIRQIPVLLIEIQTVAYHKCVRNVKHT